MKKLVLLTVLSALLAVSGFSQTANYWSASNANRSRIIADKATTRQSFPQEVKLFTLNAAPLRQVLFAAVSTPQSARRSAVIFLPNAAGGIETFEVFESSNFEPALQARFPEIRSFSGKGITDKAATLKLSISPQGIQTMVFRTGKANESIEPYSQDHTVYAVFNSQRENGSLPWICSTPDEQLATGLNQQIGNTGITARSGGNLKTMRLAQSVNAEYSNYFGATSASQVGLVLAAVNATLTRCNGVYERDLALHLNLIDSSTKVFYYNPSTDPYSNVRADWNVQLQRTLTTNISEANYDIGHLFLRQSEGGNAGCIGCICEDGAKGSGWTSTLDGAPTGYTFDCIVMHEVGHQLGANHTFSHNNEGTGANKEVGSGITIMGYAGITAQDVAATFNDVYHEHSIAQIEANLANKTCPVTTSITGTNATPVVAAVSNYTIPISTPFALTGAATDANTSDVLTYCWEQNDAATAAQAGASSIASPTKLVGPNWLSFRPTTSPTRLFPQLATILAGAQVTGPLPGGDAGANIEALSSVARTLNFRLTVRDNAPYRSTAPVSVGQTAFTDMVVTVNATSGPFVVTAPNTAVIWVGGTSRTITWDVANTTAVPVSCANVKISLSTDGGQTFPTVLAASTPNDGTEALTIPNIPSTTARIKVEAVGNIFFDISNTNFTIADGQKPLLIAGNTTITAQGCTPGNGVIDPGETVTVSFCVQNFGGVASTNLMGTLQNTGGVTFAGGPQTYGAVPTGGSEVCRPFTFTASGACGSTITASINLQDGATNLGTVTYTFTLGVFTSNTTATTNSTAITVPITISPATPYPSNIAVSGTTGTISKVTVQLNNLNHTYPDELDILLVSPTGQKVMLLSDAGGVTDVVNANLIFDDAAASSAPDAGPIPTPNVTTTYKPTDYGTPEVLPAPAPARPYAAALSAFNGSNPNGTWSLYVADDGNNDGGSITGGWTLNITTSMITCCVTPPPVITAPTVTQPSCATPTGTIVVNATGSGALEYSIDNGTTYQLSNTFSGLAQRNYNIRVRQQTNPANIAVYSGNPVIINAAPPLPATPTVTVTQPNSNSATGTITVNTPTGSGITYSINNTNYQTSNVFNNVAPGNYSVTAKTNDGCISQATAVTIIPYQAVLVAGGATITAQSCMPGNGVIDPGETVTVNFCVQNNGSAPTTTNLVGTLQNTGGVSGASTAQNYGAVSTGGSTCRSFSFTANGTCGGTVTASISLQDGATNLGTVTYTFTLGVITQNPAVVTTNSTSISISSGVPSPASPYPSNIVVSGITNPVSKVTVQLNNLNHTYPRDLSILLVSPTGQKVMLMSFAGGDLDVVNANLIFDDAATSSLSIAGQIPSNTTTPYKPTDFGTASLPAPAPARPYVTTLSSVNGLNPNGTWSLYVADAEDNDGGSITGGWTLNITTSTATCCTVAPIVVNAPTVTQPTCTTSTGTIVVNASGSGTLEYSINNGATYQLSNTFSGLAAGNYSIRVRQQTNPANSTMYSGNPVVINTAPATPATPTVMVTQPSCNFAAGGITVNTPTGSGITYSINGTTYQTGNVFNNVAPGNYSVTAKNSSSCVSTATPVTINAAPADTTAPVITSKNITINLDASGKATIQPADVIQSATDNCSIDNSSFTVTPNSFSCSGTNSGSANHQAYVANTTTGNQSWAGELGMAFKVNNASGIVIKQLGTFDHQGNGIAGSIRVAIFNKTTQSIVSGLDVTISGNADSYIGNHRLKNITPVTLMPGEYVVVSKGYNASDLNGNGGFAGGSYAFGDSSSGAISFINGGLYGVDNVSTFTYPSNTDPNNYLAGTFVYDLPATSSASANHQAYVASTTTGNQSWQGELGLAFKVNRTSGIIIKQLGAFDHLGDGITGTQSGGIRVAIFNKATQSIVPGLDAIIVGNADQYTGNHRLKNITPVTLMPGEYVIVSKGYNTSDLNGNGGFAGASYAFGDAGSGAISFVSGGLYGNDNTATFAYPPNADPNNYLAGTFLYDVPATANTGSANHQAYVANTTTGNQSWAGELGMEFRVNQGSGILVKQLGTFDHQGNGITGTQSGGIRVAIFNKATQSIVAGLETVIIGNADSYTGNHRMKNIAPVTLMPGDYVIVSKGYNANELNGNSGFAGVTPVPGDVSNGAISYTGTSLYGNPNSSMFSYPSNGDGGPANRYLAGTFVYDVPGTTGGGVGNNSVVISVKDAAGNIGYATATVTVTDANGVCNQSQSMVSMAAKAAITPVLAGAATMRTEGIKVYPNPSTGAFTVQLSDIKVPKVTLQIMDANGKIVEQRVVNTTGKMPSLTVPVDISRQAAGMYIIKVISADGVQTAKVVVSR